MTDDNLILEKIKILYEDESVLVINKPAGLIVHSDGRNIEPSVADWVIEKFPALKDVGEPWISPQGKSIPRPGIVHRLDRETSGVLIIAKTQNAHVFLKQQFQERSIEKHYRAFVYGHPKEDNGVIEAEIGRTKNIPRRWTAFPRGKTGNLRAAITHWKVLNRFADPETQEKISFLEASPKTGRTHQIRVHFKFLNHPILCDKIYAPKRPCLLGFERLALHSFKIRFQTPDEKTLEIEAPYPEDFKKAIKIFFEP